MKIDPLEPKDDWLADEYWGPDQDEPEEESDEEEFIEQSEETIKEMSDGG